jgi:hypothetical protein
VDATDATVLSQDQAEVSAFKGRKAERGDTTMTATETKRQQQLIMAAMNKDVYAMQDIVRLVNVARAKRAFHTRRREALKIGASSSASATSPR